MGIRCEYCSDSKVFGFLEIVSIERFKSKFNIALKCNLCVAQIGSFSKIALATLFLDAEKFAFHFFPPLNLDICIHVLNLWCTLEPRKSTFKILKNVNSYPRDKQCKISVFPIPNKISICVNLNTICNINKVYFDVYDSLESLTFILYKTYKNVNLIKYR